MGQNDEKIELKIENNQIWVSNFKKNENLLNLKIIYTMKVIDMGT